MGELWGLYCEPLESIECLITGLDWIYRQTFNRSRALVGNGIVDHSAPVGAAPTTNSLFST